jgi:GTP pyrophosphokinase
MNLYSKEIYILHPKEILNHSKGATSLDFAFSILRNRDKTRGTRVNGKLVPLNYELRSGDQVEIITSAIKTNNKLVRLCNYFASKKIKYAMS